MIVHKQQVLSNTNIEENDVGSEKQSRSRQENDSSGKKLKRQEIIDK